MVQRYETLSRRTIRLSPNTYNETATMPSYFPCIKSSESHRLVDWLYLKSVITSSPELRMMTETYRKRLTISKQFADPDLPF